MSAVKVSQEHLPACASQDILFTDNIPYINFIVCNIPEIIDIAQDSLRPVSVCPKLCLF